MEGLQLSRDDIALLSTSEIISHFRGVHISADREVSAPSSGEGSVSLPLCSPVIAPESAVSSTIAVMSISMFELAMTHNGEGWFLFGWSI